MSIASESTSAPRGHTAESLQTLAALLEVSLEKGTSVVMVRRGTGECSVYIGKPGDEDAKLTGHGTIPTAVAEELLVLTQAGLNRMTVGDQTYRFFRSFTQLSDLGAVVFAPT
jgi:hypothetical protein